MKPVTNEEVESSARPADKLGEDDPAIQISELPAIQLMAKTTTLVGLTSGKPYATLLMSISIALAIGIEIGERRALENMTSLEHKDA